MNNNKKMAKIKKEDQPFVFPASLLNQISECSAGGFLLFTVAENGSIIPFVELNSEVVGRAMIDYCGDFVKSFKQINSNGILSQMSDSFEEEAEDGDSDLDL